MTTATLANKNSEKNWKWWLARGQDAFIDWTLGIRTRGVTPIPLPGSEVSMTLPYRDIVQILSYLELQPSDVVIDIGCGKGRVVCCVARFGVREVIGIDHALEQCVAARENVARLRGKRSSVKIIHAGATEYDYRYGTVLYLYNPFSAAILNDVLKRIKETWGPNSGNAKNGHAPLRIIYANPVLESSLAALPWLEMTDRWEAGGRRGLAVPVSFWRTKKE